MNNYHTTITIVITALFSAFFVQNIEFEQILQMRGGTPKIEFYYDEDITGYIQGDEKGVQIVSDYLSIRNKTFKWYGLGAVMSMVDCKDELWVHAPVKLGADAPAIRQKLISGHTSTTQGGAKGVDHGILDRHDILSAEVFIHLDTENISVPPNSHLDSRHYNYYINNTQIILINELGNSGLILDKPFTILITYIPDIVDICDDGSI